MAIDRKDYQYIHNTLDKKSIASNDNTLKVGSKVKNLLLELSEENIWNGDFQDYYGSRPSQCWEPYSLKGETIETVISRTEGDPKGENENWTITQKKTSVVVPGIGSGNIGIVGPDGSIIGSKPGSGSNIKYITYYKLEYYYKFPEGQNKQNVTDIVVDNVINSQSYNSASYKWKENSEDTIICYFYSTVSRVEGILRYIVKQEVTANETVKNGTLYYTTSIKPETSYVLQVINAVSPSNVSIEKRNQIALTNSKNKSRYINFDQYLFFETGADEVKIKLSIEGLSFGYQIYGIKDNKEIYELRCFKTTTQAKVFLFESKHPWTIDNDGIIRGLSETYLNVSQQSSTTPIEGSFSTGNLENLFKETPSLYIDGKKLIIPFPNSVLDGDQWKWKTEILWKYVGKKANYPKIMDNIYLLVYRNYLTDENRDYNDIQTTTQYGLLRTVQKTSTSSKDPYIQNINYSIQLNQKLLSGISPKKHNNSTFDFSPVSFDITHNPGTEAIIINKKTDIDWYILPLLGYNYTYSVINNKKDIYKYTSFSFAWGKRDNGKFIRLSDFSTPIIVDRSIMEIADYNSNKQYSLTPKDWNSLKWIETDATEYYPFKAIYLTTENITNITNE